MLLIRLCLEVAYTMPQNLDFALYFNIMFY